MDKKARIAFYGWYLIFFVCAITGSQYVYVSTRFIGLLYDFSKIWAAVIVVIVFITGTYLIRSDFSYLFLILLSFDGISGIKFLGNIAYTKEFWDNILLKIITVNELHRYICNFNANFYLSIKVEDIYYYLSVLLTCGFYPWIFGALKNMDKNKRRT